MSSQGHHMFNWWQEQISIDYAHYQPFITFLALLIGILQIKTYSYKILFHISYCVGVFAAVWIGIMSQVNVTNHCYCYYLEQLTLSPLGKSALYDKSYMLQEAKITLSIFWRQHNDKRQKLFNFKERCYTNVQLLKKKTQNI